jgi:V8-like Glu-specific endopeptidase
VSALTLAEQQSPVGAEVSVLAGYWKRIYTCTVDSYVYRMHEADWTWEESMQYRQPGCEIVGGTSGGPVVSHDTGEVVAINNTSNEQGRRCTLNNPCEETPNGRISVEQGEAYAQQSTWFYTCLTDARELDLTLEDCRLPAP